MGVSYHLIITTILMHTCTFTLCRSSPLSPFPPFLLSLLFPPFPPFPLSLLSPRSPSLNR